MAGSHSTLLQVLLVILFSRLAVWWLRLGITGRAVGIKELDDGIWLVSFMDYDLGYIGLEEKSLPPLAHPFGPRA